MPSTRFRRFSLQIAFLAIAVIGFVAPAFGSVVGEVRSGDDIRGTIGPGDEADVFSVRCPDLSKIKVKLTGPKKGGGITFVLKGPDGELVPGADVKLTKRGASLGGVVAQTAGAYTVEVSVNEGGAGGDYKLKFFCKAPKKRKFERPVADVEESYDFFAIADTTVKAKLTPARGSAAVPRVLRIEGPDGFLLNLDTPAKSVKTGKLILTRTGGYSLFFVRDGTDGEVKGSLALKEPKLAKRRFDVRDSTIGTDGDDVAIAGVIGSEGGSLVVPGDLAASSIFGAALDVPAGALATPTALIIGSSSDLEVDDPELSDVGPPVFFGPEKLAFMAPLTVTIPYDAREAGLDDLVIWTRDANGNLTIVDPDTYAVNTIAGTISFQASHFSSFQAFTTPRPPEPAEIATMGDLDNPEDVATSLFGLAQGKSATVEGGRFGASGFAATGSTVYALYGYGQYSGAYLFAGGGEYTASGYAPTEFDFQGTVRSVTAFDTGPLSSTVYVATSTRVYAITLDQKGAAVTHIAGTGSVGDTGDGSSALNATFTAIRNLAVNAAGNVLVVDRGAARVRVIDRVTGDISTLIGTGQKQFGNDGVALASASCLDVTDIVESGTPGIYYITDAARVRQIGQSGQGPEVNVTFAGDSLGGTGTLGDGGPPLNALFQSLRGIARDPISGVVFVVDEFAHTVRTIDEGPGGIVKLLAGTPNVAQIGPAQFDAPGTLHTPVAIAVSGGACILAEAGSDKVRVILPPRRGEVIPGLDER